MKEQCRILVVGLLAVLVFAGAVQAEERSRAGELRGTFVRLTEQRVGERGYMGVVIKPLEGRELVTVLLSPRQEELVAMARELREGQRLEVAYVTEAGHKWVKELEAEGVRAVVMSCGGVSTRRAPRRTASTVALTVSVRIQSATLFSGRSCRNLFRSATASIRC